MKMFTFVEVLLMICVCIVLYIVLLYIQLQANVRKYGHIPYRTQLLVWFNLSGQVLMALGLYRPKITATNAGEVVAELMDESNSDVVALLFGDHAIVFARTPELFKEIGVTKRKSYPKAVFLYQILTHQFGSNVVASEGKEWRHHRAVVNPAFGKRNNEAVVTTTVKYVREMFQRWDECAEGALIPLQENFFSLTLAIIGEAGFGQSNMDPFNLHGKVMPAEGRRLTFKEALDGVIVYTLPKLVLPNFVYKLPVPYFKRIYHSFNEFEAYLDDVIQRRKVQGGSEIEEEQPGDLLSLLVNGANKSEDPLTPRELKSDAFVFLLAGHETTAVTLSWTLALLSLHEEVQDKLREESMKVLGPARNPTLDDFEKLEYTRCVMMESLRMYPPVSGVPKIACEDVMMGKTFVPKDTLVILSQHALQYDARVHPDPKTFRPERFMDKTMDKYATAPFSVGVRACLGRKFAEIEIVLCLAMMFRKYRVAVPSGITEEYMFEQTSRITKKPKNPVKLLVSRW